MSSVSPAASDSGVNVTDSTATSGPMTVKACDVTESFVGLVSPVV